MVLKSVCRKGSLDLSVSMIVMLILCSVILTMGVVLVNKMYWEAKHKIEILDDKAEADLFDALDEGQRVVNPFNKKTISPREIAKIYLRVRNKLDSPIAHGSRTGGNYFRLILTPSEVPAGYDVADAESWIRVVNNADWVIDPPANQIDEYIANNDHQTLRMGIVASKDAIPGTYAFTLEILYADPSTGGPDSYLPYASVEKLYVIVEK